MKRKFNMLLLLIVLFFILFTSCDSDSTNENNENHEVTTVNDSDKSNYHEESDFEEIYDNRVSDTGIEESDSENFQEKDDDVQSSSLKFKVIYNGVFTATDFSFILFENPEAIDNNSVIKSTNIVNGIGGNYSAEVVFENLEQKEYYIGVWLEKENIGTIDQDEPYSIYKNRYLGTLPAAPVYPGSEQIIMTLDDRYTYCSTEDEKRCIDENSFTTCRDLTWSQPELCSPESTCTPGEGCLSCTASGVFSISGNDSIGKYTGKAEIRNVDGSLKFYRVLNYTDYIYEENRISMAHEGEATLNENSIDISFPLSVVGFLKEIPGLVRDSDFNNNFPALFSGVMSEEKCGVYSGNFTSDRETVHKSFIETWTKVGESGEKPIWQNLREDLKTTEDAGSATIDIAIWSGQTEYDEEHYNSLPEIAPHTEKQEFKDKIHLWVFDPTDYDFYQSSENHNSLRVIQSVVDPISISEAKTRRGAYRWKLNDKEAHYMNEVRQIVINEVGMVGQWNPVNETFAQEGDSLLWTGVYVAAMSKKYLLTKDPEALDYMLKSLNAVIACVELVQNDPGISLEDTFARAIRMPENSGDPEFRAGTMPYSTVGSIEYKIGGNNDMTKGFFAAAHWSNKVFQKMSQVELDAVHSKYGDMKKRMIDALFALRSEHEKLFVNKCRFYKPQELKKWRNVLQMNLILWNLIQGTPYESALDFGDDIDECYDLLKPYMKETDINYMNYGYSISDWSGNHLGIWGLYNNYMGFVEAKGASSSYAEEYRRYFKDADQHMLTHRLGFFKLVTGALREMPNHPYWIDQAIWRLRELPIPRSESYIDWTINPEYTPSPYPALIWKYKKSEASSRVQSLRAYPLFQSEGSVYSWKDNPFDKFKAGYYYKYSGLDFLIAYWFGRYHNVITEDM